MHAATRFRHLPPSFLARRASAGEDLSSKTSHAVNWSPPRGRGPKRPCRIAVPRRGYRIGLLVILRSRCRRGASGRYAGPISSPGACCSSRRQSMSSTSDPSRKPSRLYRPRLMAVPIKYEAQSIVPGPAKRLFKLPLLGGMFGVADNGRRFLLLKPEPSILGKEIHVVGNWFEELNRVAPPTETRSK